ncbi:hypothetical protein ABZ752_15355 [Streptomyces roseifaciens]
MPFPDGVQTVTVTAGAAGYRHLDGTPYIGTIRLTPSVPRVTSATHGVIALGTVNVTLSASGMFTTEVLAIDASGFSPSGWTYRVDEEFTNAPGSAYNISLPASTTVVALPSVARVEPATGTGTSYDPAGTAATLVAAHSADTTDVHGIANAAALETQSGAAAKVTAHAAASDPHGDRAYADLKLARASNLSDLLSASASRTNLGLGTAAVANVGTSPGTVAAGDDSRLSNARTPTAHAAAGSDPVTLSQAQVTGLVSALLPLAGGTIAGDLTVNGYIPLQGGQFNSDVAAFGDLRLIGSGKAYRLRRGGSALDLEGGGADLLLSVWSGGDFTGTQHSYFRLSADAQNVQVAGRVEYVNGLYGATRHVIDGAANVLGFYGKSPVAQQPVTGPRSTGAALESLLAALDALGLIDDQSTA